MHSLISRNYKENIDTNKFSISLNVKKVIWIFAMSAFLVLAWEMVVKWNTWDEVQNDDIEKQLMITLERLQLKLAKTEEMLDLNNCLYIWALNKKDTVICNWLEWKKLLIQTDIRDIENKLSKDVSKEFNEIDN